MRRLLLLVALPLAACGEPFAPVTDDATSLKSQCAAPLPVGGVPSAAAPGYLVLFRDGVNAATETERLERQYGFSATEVWRYLGGFFVERLEAPALEALRCQTSISSIDHNAMVQVL